MLCALLPLATAGSPALASGSASTAAASSSTHPNILLIVSDDQAWSTFNRDLMPTVYSQLVDQGVLFKRAYVNTSLCCPSRAQIVSGLYEHDTGVDQNEVLLDSADVPDGAARRRIPHDARRQVHEQLAVRPARRVRPVGVRRDARDLLAVPGRPHGQRQRRLAAEDRLRAGRARRHGLRLHQEHARRSAVLRDVHADHAAPAGRRHPVRGHARLAPAGTGVQLEHHDGRRPRRTRAGLR